uniref:Uncharacterized protein n=1 Tax=Rhizophora mucronata TaxID=61149 RepID=A0A2P2QSS0_RHIMU
MSSLHPKRRGMEKSSRHIFLVALVLCWLVPRLLGLC